ncbi:metallophosphoesterase family protein [Furfurilactobacillus curtus]|uniref:Metallophosphoesterase n=1 Tax=Furfurilactobacillus curtus TaxID=1746200 RepID=A0ABQ5JNB0_9LACO
MEHKIAVISDSHGNATALAAVLDDARQHQATDIWSLGDIGFGGPGTAQCYQLLADANTSQYLMGNWETDFNLVLQKKAINLNDPSDVYFVMLVRYDYARLSKQQREKIQTLPMASTKTINGFKISLSHNLPRENSGHSLFPTQPQGNFDQLISDPNTDVAIYAHIHMPLFRYTASGQLILNPGSVGQPWSTQQHLLANRAASYVLLTISESGIEGIDFRRIHYDQQIELNLAQSSGFPYPELYKKLLETGIASTHDLPLLTKINSAHHYRDLAEQFLSQLPDQHF